MSSLRITLALAFALCCSVCLSAQITWMTWDEAVAANKQQPKKLLVDVYTEWCGYCKKMDAMVFTDPAVEAFIKKNFYAVKFDAEQKETIRYDGFTFNFNPNVSRRGAHDLAIALLESRMSYPSIVYLDENRDRISISPGFKPADKFLTELNFIQGGHYKLKTYQEYLATLGK